MRRLNTSNLAINKDSYANWIILTSWWRYIKLFPRIKIGFRNGDTNVTPSIIWRFCNRRCGKRMRNARCFGWEGAHFHRGSTWLVRKASVLLTEAGGDGRAKRPLLLIYIYIIRSFWGTHSYKINETFWRAVIYRVGERTPSSDSLSRAHNAIIDQLRRAGSQDENSFRQLNGSGKVSKWINDGRNRRRIRSIYFPHPQRLSFSIWLPTENHC